MQKLQKKLDDPFLGKKIFNLRAFFLVKDDFFKDLYFDWALNTFLGPGLQKSILPNKWDIFGTDSMRNEKTPLWCGYLNHAVCRKWKCKVDHPSQPTIVTSRSEALCDVFYLKFSRIHLAQILFKFLITYGQYISDVQNVPVSEIEPRC